MAQKLDPEELVSFKELLISNMVEIQAIAQLLMKKGVIDQQEYFAELKQVQAEYNKKSSHS